MYCFDSLATTNEEHYRNYWNETGSTEIIEKAIMKIPTTQNIEELIKYGETNLICEASFRIENLETDESSLMLLLLQSGYITSFEKNICKIPNYEIQYCFFGDFIKAWLKKYIPDYSIPFDLANIENTKKYGDEFKNKFLQKMIYEDYNESFFKLWWLFHLFLNAVKNLSIKFILQSKQLKNQK